MVTCKKILDCQNSHIGQMIKKNTGKCSYVQTILAWVCESVHVYSGV